MKKAILAVATLAGSGVLAMAPRAEAANPTCSGGGNASGSVVTVAGSTASQAVWASIGPTLAKKNIIILYQGPSSCVGLNEVVTGQADAASDQIYDMSVTPAAGEELTGTPCTGTPATVDIGVSDVFPESCGTNVTGGWPQAGFADNTGPIQVMEMVVPNVSSEFSITADAAYAVFAWGGTNYVVGNWNSWENVFIRSATSGTEIMIAGAIGLPAAKWLSQTPDGGGQNAGGSGGVLKDIRNANSIGGTVANSAIGILTAAFADSARGKTGLTDAGTPTGGVKTLAFQATGQDCGYLPDSDATHLDRINVRQGRYDIWGPLHMVVALGDGGVHSTNVQTVVNFVQGVNLDASDANASDFEALINADIAAYVVPQCAMQVSRAAEVSTVTGGGMASYQPTVGCGCYFEAQSNGGQPYSSYCTACSSSSPCTSSTYSKCNFGFCEVQ